MPPHGSPLFLLPKPSLAAACAWAVPWHHLLLQLVDLHEDVIACSDLMKLYLDV